MVGCWLIQVGWLLVGSGWLVVGWYRLVGCWLVQVVGCWLVQAGWLLVGTGWLVLGWLLVGYHPNNMLVYLRDGPAQTYVVTATLRKKFQIRLSILPSHSILIHGQPVLSLTLYGQVPGSVATRASVFKLLV